ncbi:MAG TPA: FAD-dependent oxidoreductase [Jiangellaceae bacterium]|nr:FAD-dependent oxidoreductase [Jiangellaceae bacterium]
MSAREVVVVGGGAMGSAAAWQLVRRGVGVTLLEQFEKGHTRGGSHGSSRIVRLSYDDPLYIDLAAAGYEGWAALEDECGEQLLTWTGVVDHGDPATVRAIAAAMQSRNHAVELVDPEAARERWPGLRFDTPVLFHPRGGRAHADRTVAGLQRVAAARGAEIRHGVEVEAVVPGLDTVEIRTAGGTLLARHVVIAAGSWTAQLLDGVVALPSLTVTREQPAHFPAREPGMRWPSFIHHLAGSTTRGAATPRGTYGLAGPDGVKVGFHAVGPVVDPRAVPDQTDEPRLRELQEYVARWIPGADSERPVADGCLYDLTDTADFVVDRVGSLTIAAGFSGHGFKFVPEIGRLVADLVLGTGFPPTRFAIAR